MSHLTETHPELGTFAHEGAGHWTGHLAGHELTIDGDELRLEPRALASAVAFARRPLQPSIDAARAHLRDAKGLSVRPAADDELEARWLEARHMDPAETVAIVYADEAPGSSVIWKVVLREGRPVAVEQDYW
jgi:hypothetical protein